MPLRPLVRFLFSAMVFAVGLLFGGRAAFASVGSCEEVESREVAPVVAACLALIEAGSDLETLPGFCSPAGTSDVAPPPMAPQKDGGTISACDEEVSGDSAKNGGPLPGSSTPDLDAQKAVPAVVTVPLPVLTSREVSFAPPSAFVPDGVRSRVDRPPTR